MEKFYRIKLFFYVIALMLVFYSSTVFSATVIVDASGTGDFTTIQAAIDAPTTIDGDIILVKDGVYTENVYVYKAVIIRSENGYNSTTVETPNYDNHVFEIFYADYPEIEGFTISGATGGSAAGIHLAESQHCTISNNRFILNTAGVHLSNAHNNFVSNNMFSTMWHAIFLSGSDDNSISNNLATESGGNGIYLSNSNRNTLSDNICNSNWGDGIELNYSNNNILSNNTCEDNSSGIDIRYESSGNTVTENMCSNNYEGIFIYENSTNNIIFHNSFTGNSTYGIYVMDTTNNIIYFNYISGNGTSPVRSRSDSVITVNSWRSPTEMGYRYDGVNYLSFLGNYYSDHDNTDVDNNGIADNPYDLPGNEPDDEYPLAVSLDAYTVTVNSFSKTIFATNSIYLTAGVIISSGDIGVLGASPGPWLASESEITLGTNVFLNEGTCIYADTIFIGSGSSVDDIFYNEITNSGTVRGEENTPLGLPLDVLFPEFPIPEPGTEDYTLRKGEILTLEPGSYGEIFVKGGAVLYLTGGTYHFENLKLGRVVGKQPAKVFCQNPTEIVINNRLDTGLEVILGPDEGSMITAKDILIYVNGINGTTGDLGATPKAAKIGETNTILANIFAPNGTILINGNSFLEGSFIGRDVEVGNNVEVTLNSGW